MRIAVNTRLLLQGRLEGIGWFEYHTLRRMAAAHPEHQFIFFFDRPYDAQFVFRSNVTPVVAPPPTRHPVLWLVWLEVVIPRLLRRHKADVFLSPDGLGSLTTRVPQCLVVHDLAFEHFPEHMASTHARFMRYFLPRYARKAAQVVAVSGYTKSDLVTRYGIDADKISVACNGAHEAYRPLSWEERDSVKAQWTGGNEYFIYAGAVQPRKNILRLLQAFVQFKKRQRSDMKLVIAGRMGWKYDEVLAYKEAMPFKADVIWTGYCEIEDLTRLMGGAYALVYPSLFEGFGIPILEALQCGVPAIVGDNSSMPEVGGAACLVCNATDAADISHQMERLYKDETLRNRLIAAAPAQTAKYNWERAAEVLWNAVEVASAAGTRQ